MSRKRPRFSKEEIDSLDEKVEDKEQKEKSYDAFEFLKDKKQTAAVAGIFFLVGFVVSWAITPYSMDGYVIEKGLLTNADEIGENGVEFINNYFVDGGGVSLVSVEEDGELLKVTTEYQGNEIPVHMTRDGKFIILGGVGAIDMGVYEEEMAAALDDAQQAEDTQTAETGAEKSDRPVANVFVMSHCPYGLQMQKALIPVIDLLGDKADISVNFVDYLMHGRPEMEDNNNQYCIQKDQPEKFTDYLTCFVEKGDHDECASEAGIDTAKHDACLVALEEEFSPVEIFEASGDSYPPYPVDAVLDNQYGVGGSPTFILNGVKVSVSRSPEAVKQAICSAFNNPPEECDTQLSSAQEAPGFGPLESGGGSETTASCS
jgi:hypothetical protein